MALVQVFQWNRRESSETEPCTCGTLLDHWEWEYHSINASEEKQVKIPYVTYKNQPMWMKDLKIKCKNDGNMDKISFLPFVFVN